MKLLHEFLSTFISSMKPFISTMMPGGMILLSSLDLLYLGGGFLFILVALLQVSKSGNKKTQKQSMRRKVTDGSMPAIKEKERVHVRPVQVNLFKNLFSASVDNHHVCYRVVERGVCVSILHGCVTTFQSSVGAIVNPTDEEGLGSGIGPDKAITNAGGPKLTEERMLVSLSNGIRFPMGTSHLLGPDEFGEIGTPYVIMTAAPNSSACPNLVNDAVAGDLLWDTFKTSLDATLHKGIEQVAIPLMSVNGFSGEQDIKKVLGIALAAIHVWINEHKNDPKNQLRDIVVFIGKRADAKKVMKVCDDEFGGYTKAIKVGT